MPGSTSDSVGNSGRIAPERILIAALVVVLTTGGIGLVVGTAVGSPDASKSVTEFEGSLAGPTADSSGNLTASVDTDYLVEIEPTLAEAGETVEVPIRAKTLVGNHDDATVTGYEVGVEFDDEKLVYRSADSPVAADQLEVEVDPDDPGRVDLVFDTSVWDNIYDEIIGGITGEDPFPTMNTTLVRVEFQIIGEANQTTDLNLVDSDSSLWHGLTDWLGKYDDDNVRWTGGQVEIVDEIEEDGPTVGVPEYQFAGENTGGYVAISEEPNDPENAEAEGVPFPTCEDDGECIDLEGVTYDTGFWESTKVEFPTLEADGGVEVDVVAPDGLWGRIDRENGTMTARGEFRAMVDGDPDDDFYFEVNATTGESGALVGNGQDLDEPNATVLVVDNEFVVADSTGTAVDPGLGIPNENPGENYLSLPLAVSFKEADEDAIPGEIEIQVTDGNGDPIEDASVDVADGPDGLTNESGMVVFETNPGSYEATVSKDGYEPSSIEFDVLPDDHTDAAATLTVAEPYFNVTTFGDEVRAGDTATASVGVVNEGGPGEQEINIDIAGPDASTTETLQLETGEHQSVELAWETEPGDKGTYTVTAGSADASDEAEIVVKEPLGDGDSEVVALFSAKSTIGGWISFDQDTTKSQAREEGLEIPPANASDDREIRIEGEIYADGTWESTGVQFPDLNADGIAAEVEVPGGMAGLIDLESGSMTGEGTLKVILPEGDPFSFNVNLVTGESGALSGAVDFGADPVEATLVDNEYTIDDQTGENFIDDALGLPATTVGAQWLKLDLAIDIEEDVELARGTVTGTVETEAGGPLEGVTVDVQDEVADATTDENGQYELEIDEGTYTLVVDTEGFDEQTATVDVVEGETTEQSFTLESGDPTFSVDISGDYVTEGETATVDVTVENVGEGSGKQSVAISFADESVTQTIDLDAGESHTESVEWDTESGDAGEYAATVESADETATAEVIVEEARESEDGIDARFTAVSTGGYVATDAQSREAAIEEGIQFPAKGEDDQYIRIEGAIEDGEWYATSVHFPTVEAEGGIEADVSAPAGLDGTIDREQGLFTASGQLQVAVGEYDFSFALDLTTGESGSLTGEVSEGSLKLVDNQFVVDEETSNSVLDGALGLPATEPGTNWMELELAMEFEEVDEPVETEEGTVTGVVESSDGDLVSGATVDVEDELSRTTSGSQGAFELELAPGTYTLSVDADGYAPTTTTVTVVAEETVEQDVVLSPGQPDLDASVSATTLDDQTVLVTGTVRNVGDGPATKTARLELGDHSKSRVVTVAPGDEQQFEVEWTVEEDPMSYEARLTIGDASATAAVTRSDGDDDGRNVDEADGATVFTATGQGGFISISQDTLEDAQMEGLAFPAKAHNDTYIELTGVIYDNGTWESRQAAFPTLQVTDNLLASVEVPSGLTGEIDRESGAMTAEGELVVEVLDAADGEPVDGEPFSFAFELTTGKSGSLQGSTTLSDTSGSVSLVSNDYVIEDTTGNAVIDSALELPATAPGRNWLELEFDVEIEDDADPNELAGEDELGGSGDSPGEVAGPESGGSFLAALGQLIGLLGVTSAAAIVGSGIVTRVLKAIDPDPGT